MRISDWSSDVCSSDLCFGTVDFAETEHDARRLVPAQRRKIIARLPWHAEQAGADARVDRVQGVDRAEIERLQNQPVLKPVFTHRRFNELRELDRIDIGILGYRSEERRVGKECGRTCRSRWSP